MTWLAALMCVVLLSGFTLFLQSYFSEEDLRKAKLMAEIIFISAGVYFGHVLTTSLKTKELSLQYLQFSAGMLAEKPSPENAPLREWAINAFQKYVDPDLRLSDEAKATLRKYPAKGFLNEGFLSTGFMTEEKINAILENDGGHHLQEMGDGAAKAKAFNEMKEKR